ncbi:MAG: MBL fold metallo-hydrolase [Deltaproteobacteria bacterium]|nr:MBL fold metallo-hydrolase [Deltaproteobacteria bacterium]
MGRTYLLPLLLGLTACGQGLHPLPPLISQDSTAPVTSVEQLLRITVFDVGQGDAALIRAPNGASILIDGGPPGTGQDVILPYFVEHGIDRLDLSLASHYDLDHIGGLPEVFDGPDGIASTSDDLLPVACWDRGGAIPDDTAPVRVYADRRSPCHHEAAPGIQLPVAEGLTLTVLAVNGRFADGTMVPLDPADENAHSMAILLTYRQFTYLSLGDLPGGGGDPPYTAIDLETPLAALLGPVDLLYIAHHGSHTSTNQTLLDAASPGAAIISVGNANPYGHPHRAVLDRLAARGIPIYLTEGGDNTPPPGSVVSNGHIEITTDGRGVTTISGTQ